MYLITPVAVLPCRYQQAELVHCRFAMLGAAGVLIPDLLHSAGLGGPAAAVPWYEAGTYEYFAPPSALFASMMFLFAWAEGRRWVWGWALGGCVTGIYPNGG